MRTDTSLYMIKPEAMHARRQIRFSIQQQQLSFGGIRTLVLPVELFDAFYPDFTEQLRTFALDFFRTQVEIGLVHGPDAVVRLHQIAGLETAPHLCHPHTIRYRFGIHTPRQFGLNPYYLNGIHRPKDRSEADEQLNLVVPLFGRESRP
jgi:nucleoside diphosphate kinase